MPYRRLPNTDAARVRALQAALDKGQNLEMDDIAYPYPLKQRIEFFLPKFKAAVETSKFAREQQFDNSPKFTVHAKKARLYVSHFIQVLNFCILRGELKPSIKKYYGLDEKDYKVPSLSSEQELLEWGQKIIDGEHERLSNREGSPIYCPSIAVVKSNYEIFRDNYYRQKQFQTNRARESGNVAQLRKEADELILELWNGVEATFASEHNEDKRRSNCEEYGLTYVYRKGEKERIRKKQEVERITLKLF